MASLFASAQVYEHTLKVVVDSLRYDFEISYYTAKNFIGDCQ
jgi:hypothetical protein